MRALRQVTLLFVAGLVLIAPLLCVRFCELQRHIAWPRITLAEMVRLHALSLSERKSQQHTHDHGDDRAPLMRLKQMVNSVTEFILTLSLAIGASAAVRRFVILRLRLSQPALAVPTPPPRPLHDSPHPHVVMPCRRAERVRRVRGTSRRVFAYTRLCHRI